MLGVTPIGLTYTLPPINKEGHGITLDLYLSLFDTFFYKYLQNSPESETEFAFYNFCQSVHPKSTAYRVGTSFYICITLTLIHLADAFIQSDLQLRIEESP